MDYNTIKDLAAENGLRIADLLALAPANDPFYTGRPAEIDAANWFTALWYRFGYGGGIHLRRIHYQIVSQDPPINMPNGNTYENTQNCWDFLNNAAKWARYLDMVPADRFVDRRNPDAIICRSFYEPDDWGYQDPRPGYQVINNDGDWLELYQVPDLPALPDLPGDLPDMPGYRVTGYETIEQPYLVEIWAEKTTMNDVLLPLCQRYGVNLVTGAGELSITAVIDFLKRAERSGLPARILYVSDFDPAGLGMPISVARKIEYYHRKEQYNVEDITLTPVVLTPEQIAEYDLPRVPVKDSDRRKGGFEAAYGAGQVELDALEALHPGELARIVEQAILNYFDETLYTRAVTEKKRLVLRLYHERQAILDDRDYKTTDMATRYDDIRRDYEETRIRFNELVTDFQDELDTYHKRLADLRADGLEHYAEIENALSEQAATINLDDYALPDADLPPEPEHLYDSCRSYIDQLRHYKAHRHNAEQLIMEVA